ncbi:MAG: hypothetical protein IK099_01465 [Clostridia bacterium]|nr:hypothetical protein [Clostridia bacterium]
MGNWSPYSEEWEKQRTKKIIEENDKTRKEFEQKKWLYKASVRFLETIKYYSSLLLIHFHMLVDREYRKEMKQLTSNLENNVFRPFVNMLQEKSL